MSSKHLVGVAAIAFSLVAGAAFAESEGNGDPFVFHADAQPNSGGAFMAETGSAAYPEPTGNRNQPSSLAQLEPVLANEAPVQTASSLPRGFDDGTIAYAQARRPHRRFAKAGGKAFLEVGDARPNG